MEHKDQPAPAYGRSIAGPEPGAPGAPGSRLLEVREVSKWYGGVKAVSEVSFSLDRGEILGIVGPNGAGKTSLVDVIAGVQSGDSGEVMIGEFPASGGIASRARMGLSRTFQHPQLADELTVAENVELGYLRDRGPASWVGMFLWFLRALVRGDRRRLQDSDESSAPERTDKTGGDSDELTWEELRSLLPEDLRRTQMEQVSYGTEKLAEVARAIVSRPDIILMDEPFAGLDGESVAVVCRILGRFASQGVGLVVVDHNLDILQNLCTRMIVLDQGEVIADDTPDVVLGNERVRVAYFGEAKQHASRDRA